MLRSVYKPYFVEGGHLSGRSVTRALLRFTRKSTEPSRLWHSEECFSLFNLAPEGGYLAMNIATHAGGLLHHLFTLTCRRHAVCFCGPIQKFAPLQVLPGILLYGVRTFLTAREGQRAHPTDLSM